MTLRMILFAGILVCGSCGPDLNRGSKEIVPSQIDSANERIDRGNPPTYPEAAAKTTPAPTQTQAQKTP